jgi:hypothetical protein
MYGLIAAAIVLSGWGAAGTETVGACVWARLAAPDRQAILTGYANRMGEATDRLYALDADILAKAGECTGRSDIPKLWLQASVASHVIQLGAAENLLGAKSIARERLDAAWALAPEKARDCTLNNASRPFRVAGPACADRRAPQAFLRALDLSASEPSDRAAAEQALVYMNAKAQEQIADGLIRGMPPATLPSVDR